MRKRKRATGVKAGHGAVTFGANIRPIPEHIVMTITPGRCLCVWVPVSSRDTGPGFKGWRLKFRHADCPAKLSGEHA